MAVELERHERGMRRGTRGGYRIKEGARHWGGRRDMGGGRPATAQGTHGKEPPLQLPCSCAGKGLGSASVRSSASPLVSCRVHVRAQGDGGLVPCVRGIPSGFRSLGRCLPSHHQPPAPSADLDRGPRPGRQPRPIPGQWVGRVWGRVRDGSGARAHLAVAADRLCCALRLR